MSKLAFESDYEQRFDGSVRGEFLDGTNIEIIREPSNIGRYRHVLFDFDGTISLIREGWMEVMAPMMVEILLETPGADSLEDTEALVRDFVSRLTGKQTIYQMIRFAEEIEKRGGRALDPIEYKNMYLDRLMTLIGDRREALRCGRAKPDEMLVPGSMALLAGLVERGCRLYLASGTDEPFVKEEAELLQLTPYFGEHIYGALDNVNDFSKAMVIQRILATNRVEGDCLLGFGDGYVEIDNVKSVGGTAVGVASDEAARSGKPDEWKRTRLIGVGADLIIPDYTDHLQLIDYLFASPEETGGVK
jgi:phosphoglycolate phosphatase-like HAD superfamily hydrolase